MRYYHHSICIAVQLTVALVIFMALMGCNDHETQNTKYVKDNIQYENCISYYDEERKYNDTNALKSIVCYSDSGDTLLVDRFEDGKLTGISQVLALKWSKEKHWILR